MTNGTPSHHLPHCRQQVKSKGERKIDFNAFMEALRQICEKKGCSMESVVEQIVLAGPPT